MPDESIPEYLDTKKLTNFSGKISKIVLSVPSSNKNEYGVNQGPDQTKTISGNLG